MLERNHRRQYCGALKYGKVQQPGLRICLRIVQTYKAGAAVVEGRIPSATETQFQSNNNDHSIDGGDICVSYLSCCLHDTNEYT